MTRDLSPELSQDLPKLLCVDDDRDILTAVTRLMREDFQVIAVGTPDEALDALDLHPDIAIVLTDQTLPGTTGLQLLTRVQSKAPDAVRAVFTGYVDLKDLIEAINTSRIHRLILKPWDNEYFRVQMLEALANHTTLLEKRHLEALSVTDPVTNLKNHRYFQDRLRIETERALRHGRELSLAMLDIDHFKKINDQHGHPVGDQVLKAVAMRLLERVRSIDTVARYGGEEFGIILPDTTKEDALRVAERIRASFESTMLEGTGLKVTMSIGLAALLPSVTPAIGPAAAALSLSTARELVVRADSSLYRAKGQGRNRTIGD